MILIISDATDTQVPFVAHHLAMRGAEYVQLNVSDMPQAVVHTSTWNGRVAAQRLRTQGRDIDCGRIGSVWYRKPEPPKISEGIDPAQREYAFDETKNDLEGLYLHLRDRFWMSSIDRIRIASNKPLQLSVATDLGFQVPDTIVTNSPEEARAFFDSHDRNVVYKTMSSGTLYSQTTRWGPKTIHGRVFTTPIEADGNPDFQSVTACPCLFQEYVPKRFELRVTVVRDDVFAIEIHSQQRLETRHDWRRDADGSLTQRVHRLPPDIADKCRGLVQALGLTFGAIDLVYTPAGDYVFLEINPNGQYGWVEDVTGLPISATIADALASADRKYGLQSTNG
jgi:hypothetical protein